SGVEGWIALCPKPVICTAKVVSRSALLGLFTITDAVSGKGHDVGGAPEIDEGFPNGSQGQLCWGLKVTLMEQDCPDKREKDIPGDAAQLSCSEKLGRPVKSLRPGN